MVPFSKMGKLLERTDVCGSAVLFRREHDVTMMAANINGAFILCQALW